MHSLMIPCSFALLLLLLLLFDDAHSENLIEQVILPVDQPFDDNNNTLITKSDYTIETEIIAAKYAYLMKLRVTTSGDDDYIETYATPDTGSDLIWLNANDCVGDACHCSIENSKSKTTATTNQQYCIEEPKQFLTCEDPKYCEALESLKIDKTCPSGQSGQCEYDVTFLDGLKTHGTLGTGKFSFRIIDDDENLGRFKDDITFGVSTKCEGPLEQKSVGVVGLGRGRLSLLKQLSISDRKFSYCLPNPEKPKLKSKIKFGNKVATSDKFTRLQGGGGCKYRYCVHLATISVDDREDKITVSEKTNKVMVIDSGSTFTFLVNGLFDDFFRKVKHVIGDDHEPKKLEPYDNCFEESAVSAKKLEKVWFEFGGVGGGSGTTKIELKRENFFDRHTPDKGKTYYLCLTVVDGDKKKNKHARLYEDFGRENENSNLPHLLGNRAQMDFLVAFDLKDKKVSFDDMENCADKKNLELPVLSE